MEENRRKHHNFSVIFEEIFHEVFANEKKFVSVCWYFRLEIMQYKHL